MKRIFLVLMLLVFAWPLSAKQDEGPDGWNRYTAFSVTDKADAVDVATDWVRQSKLTRLWCHSDVTSFTGTAPTLDWTIEVCETFAECAATVGAAGSIEVAAFTQITAANDAYYYVSLLDEIGAVPGYATPEEVLHPLIGNFRFVGTFGGTVTDADLSLTCFWQ